jgi:transcriptional regulator with XRE-family HTH domain
MAKKKPPANAADLKPFLDETLGQYLRRLRLIRGINLSDVSAKTAQIPGGASVSISYLSHLELGLQQTPSREVLLSLARVLEVPPGPLFELAGYSSRGLEPPEEELDPEAREIALRAAQLEPAERRMLDTMIRGLLEHRRRKPPSKS